MATDVLGTTPSRRLAGGPPPVALAAASGPFDEAHAPGGRVLEHYAAVLDELTATDLRALDAAIARTTEVAGVAFGGPAGPSPFRLDAVPRILTAEEWAVLEAGVAQRVRALERFVADVYGEREIVAAGVVPARVVDTCDHFEPALLEVPAPPSRITVAGLDVVRDAAGRFLVLEDNVRTPSGLAYAVAAREVLDHHLETAALVDRLPVAAGFDLLKAALEAASPAEGTPQVVILSDGPRNSAWWEHARLARELDLPLVHLGELEVARGRLWARHGRRLAPVDVVLRRTDEDRLTDAAGQPTSVGAALLEPLRRGTVAVANGFGTGVADDKLAHAYVEAMIRFYLGEEPVLRSVPTLDMTRPDVRRDVLARLDQVVIKPRTGHGGHGVMIGPRSTATQREVAAAAVRRAPERFVAQETILLSRHPTAISGRLEPRHVDLRPFAFTTGAQTTVLPGGLTRFAVERDRLVVNSSQSGGGKDTWVLR